MGTARSGVFASIASPFIGGWVGSATLGLTVGADVEGLDFAFGCDGWVAPQQTRANQRPAITDTAFFVLRCQPNRIHISGMPIGANNTSKARTATGLRCHGVVTKSSM